MTAALLDAPTLTAVAEDPIADVIPVTITFNEQLQYEVDLSYILIPEHSTRTIVWTIDRTNVPEDVTIAFDNPAITLGGDAIPRTTATRAELVWTNMPSQAGRSFYYTLHMFGRRTTSETTTEYFSIDHDPTIHNEPPS